MGPQFELPSGEVDGSLNKFSVKCDGDAYTYKVDLVFPILNSKEASLLDRCFPGARETYIACTEKEDDWKEQRQVTPVFEGELQVELVSKTSARSLVKAGATVTRLTLRASKKVVTLTAQLLIPGQSEGVASNLTHGMKAPVTLLWDQAQQTLFTKKAVLPIPKVGQIVCFQESFTEEGDGKATATVGFGQVIEVLEEEQELLVSDFGRDVQVKVSEVTSCWTVNTQDDHFDPCLASYKERVKRRKLTPSWSALTQATGEAFGQQEAPGEGAHTLTKAIITRAIEILVAASTTPKLALVPSNSTVEPIEEASEAAGQA